MVGNFKNRRRIAWLSFANMTLLNLVTCYRLLKGGDPQAWAFIIGVETGLFTLIILAYCGLASYEKKLDVQHPQI